MEVLFQNGYVCFRLVAPEFPDQGSLRDGWNAGHKAGTIVRAVLPGELLLHLLMVVYPCWVSPSLSCAQSRLPVVTSFSQLERMGSLFLGSTTQLCSVLLYNTTFVALVFREYGVDTVMGHSPSRYFTAQVT